MSPKTTELIITYVVMIVVEPYFAPQSFILLIKNKNPHDTNVAVRVLRYHECFVTWRMPKILRMLTTIIPITNSVNGKEL